MQEEIKKALQVLKAGGTILYPTDTIWGIGCDATNPEAVKKVYEIKKREDIKSILVLVDSPNKIIYYVQSIPGIAWDLIDVSDKPITIIYPDARNLAGNLINQDGSIGIRVTKEEFSKKLIHRFRKPIVSTSANTSEAPYPRNFFEINEEILSAVDYVVNWRQEETTEAKPSGIIKLGVRGEVEIIRK